MHNQQETITYHPLVMSNETLPIMQTQELSLFYGSKAAFCDVNFALAEKKVTALVGASGCGKSSFLSCLNRLTDMIPRTKVSGSIRLENIEILDSKIDTIALRRRVGMIFQKPNPFPLSIWKNIAFPLKEHGIKNRQKIDYIVEQTLQDVGLWSEVKDRLKDSALSLSGGQQQRLCIARALALQPQIILMDEPCSALDPISSGVIEDLIVRLRERYTLLVVTHNLAQASRIADYTALFWVVEGSGRLIEFGSTEQVFYAPNHELTAAYVSGKKG